MSLVVATGLVVANAATSPVLVTSNSSAAAPSSARLAAGATAPYTDPSGRVWGADKGAIGGWIHQSDSAIAGTAADAVYRRHRWGATGYTLPVDCAGTFKVTMHWAETVMDKSGQRVFGVTAEGASALDEIDVFAAVGRNTALTRSFDVKVTDGKLNLGFSKIVEDPMVSGIEFTRTKECVNGRTARASSASKASRRASKTSKKAEPTAAGVRSGGSGPTPAPAAPAAAPAAPGPAAPAPAPAAPASTSGWPNASNTGVPAGTSLKPSGSITVSTPGAVIEGLDVSGGITVQADNVKIRKTRVRGGRIDAGYGGQKGLVVEDVEIDGLKQNAFSSGIGDVNFTCRRCNIHGVGHGVHMGGDVVIEDSYIHDIYFESPSHNEPIISNGGSNFVIRHNNLEMDDLPGGSASLALYGDFAPIQNVLVENNLFNGGGYCVYGGSVDGKAHPVATNVRFLNNAFGRKIHAKCGYHGPVSAWNGSGAGNVWSGNHWADSKAAV